MTKSQYRRIWSDKREDADRHRSLSDAYLAEVYYGLATKKSAREIHKEIRKVTKAYSGEIADAQCERYAMALAKKGAKKAQYAGDVPLPAFALLFLNKEKAYESTMSMAYKYAQKRESEAKSKVLKDARDEAEEDAKGKRDFEGSMTARMFYLCSEHDDCAADHLDWQGSLYYDKHWRRYVKDKAARQIAENAIKNRRMKSLQWVTDRPVWLITRPNCRHYFEQLSIADIVGKDAKTLIEMRGMHQSTGSRGDVQTIAHPMSKSWYTEGNINGIIEKYERRLRYHEALNAKMPSEKLDGYIHKDKTLIKKWRAYLKNHY